jgi:cell division protein FtsL
MLQRATSVAGPAEAAQLEESRVALAQKTLSRVEKALLFFGRSATPCRLLVVVAVTSVFQYLTQWLSKQSAPLLLAFAFDFGDSCLAYGP